MGYYIDFEFDSKYDFEAVVNRFSSTWPQNPSEDISHTSYIEFVDFLYSRIPSPIRIGDKRNSFDVRLSWRTNAEDLTDILKTLVRMADKVGYKVYDGQCNVYVTNENIFEVVNKFESSSNSITNLFGTVDKAKYVKNVNENTSFKIKDIIFSSSFEGEIKSIVKTMIDNNEDNRVLDSSRAFVVSFYDSFGNNLLHVYSGDTLGFKDIDKIYLFLNDNN